MTNTIDIDGAAYAVPSSEEKLNLWIRAVRKDARLPEDTKAYALYVGERLREAMPDE